MRLSSLLEKDAARITTTTFTFPAAVVADTDRTISQCSAELVFATSMPHPEGASLRAIGRRWGGGPYGFGGVRLKVWQPSATTDIFHREFDAMMAGMRSADPVLKVFSLFFFLFNGRGPLTTRAVRLSAS